MKAIAVELPWDLYEELRRRARPFDDTPVDVIRRLVRLEAPHFGDNRVGALEPLIRAGLIAAGDELVFPRPRVGNRHVAHVTEGGCLRLSDGTVHTTPSAAATSYTRQPQNGWTCWRHTASGKKLEALRDMTS